VTESSQGAYEANLRRLLSSSPEELERMLAYLEQIQQAQQSDVAVVLAATSSLSAHGHATSSGSAVVLGTPAGLSGAAHGVSGGAATLTAASLQRDDASGIDYEVTLTDHLDGQDSMDSVVVRAATVRTTAAVPVNAVVVAAPEDTYRLWEAVRPQNAAEMQAYIDRMITLIKLLLVVLAGVGVHEAGAAIAERSPAVEQPAADQPAVELRTVGLPPSAPRQP
jgi:hypothetical protein